MSEIHLIVNRGNADDERGWDESYYISASKGMVVLDALLQVQEQFAPDLAVRWNCKAGKCGSCSAEINGYPHLLCKTRIDSLSDSQPITVQPMQTFTRIKDLVTDVSWNYEINRELPPFQPRPGAEWKWFQRDIVRAQEMRKCIECFLCQDVCHVLRYQRTQKARYAGPRFYVRAAGLDYHPIDDRDRIAYLRDEAGIALCNVTRCCTEVCPEGIKITDNAIIPAKERIVDKYDDPVKAWLRRLLVKASGLVRLRR
jgi:succinate dehydrogenase / fumarate reductase iron-sulfur subunit